MKKIKGLLQMIKERDPNLWKKIRRNIYEYYILRNYYKLKRNKNPKLFEILSKYDWKYLIILDACRYDAFEKIYKDYLSGDLKKIYSRTSNTKEFFDQNFSDKYPTMLYVASNPNLVRNKRLIDAFFKIDHVWDYGWNDKAGIVMPKEVTDAALEDIKEYPKKKLIIHYMQPHAPYVGKKKITFSTELSKNVAKINDAVIYDKTISIKELKEAYESNLHCALSEIKRLVDSVKGTIIITADHGEAFGENNLYFHPIGIYTKELIEVPFLVIKK